MGCTSRMLQVWWMVFGIIIDMCVCVWGGGGGGGVVWF